MQKNPEVPVLLSYSLKSSSIQISGGTLLFQNPAAKLKMLSAAKAEKLGDLAGHGGHDGCVEQRIQTAEEQCADNYGDQNLYAGIDIAFSLLIGHCALCRNDCGINLILDFLKHILLPRLSSVFWCITD